MDMDDMDLIAEEMYKDGSDDDGNDDDDEANDDNDNEGKHRYMASDFFGTRAAYKQVTAKKQQQQQSKAGNASKKGRRDELEDDEDDEEDMEMDEDEDFEDADDDDEFDENEEEESEQDEDDEDEEGSDADDDNNEQQNKLPLSSYEKRKQKLSAETAELEAQLLQPKGWDMRGESRGKDRPTDSLLNVSADIER
jgi:U3 small nucleolar RNA-associated protein MPP10